MSDLIIRPFKAADKAAALELIGELQSHEQPLQPCVLPWEAFGGEFWKWLMMNVEKNSGFLLVAEAKNSILGLVAGWVGYDNYPGLKPEEQKFGYIGDIVVTASARKQGIGTALLKEAENIFRQRGLILVRLMAWANNDLAGHFYLGNGMERYVTTYKKYLEAA